MLLNEGELALSRKGQGSSIELIALPLRRLTRHGKHILIGFLGVVLGLIPFATQRVDTRAQRDKESGLPDSFTRKAPFQVAPLTLGGQYVVPAI